LMNEESYQATMQQLSCLSFPILKHFDFPDLIFFLKHFEVFRWKYDKCSSLKNELSCEVIKRLMFFPSL
jgi:hypothetical protein